MSPPDLVRPEVSIDEPPPVLGTWPRLYLAVAGWLAFQIVVFYLFARTFTP
ncbi:MAG: hypothetical protein RMK57_11115 [Bryobacterales bacterium]|nr:hypothetical protein [Bryobacteraceae bacterium]MDW8355069.1 hypothetical protein [Bryobacterales bacterium]